MTFPYIAEANFESGTTAEFTSETDTEAKLIVAHYTTLAQHGARLELPHTGAYCAYINLALGTADAYLQEDTLYDLAADGTVHVRFMFYAKGLVMAASDRFTIFTLDSAGPVNEATISVLNNAGVLTLVGAETGATAIGSGRACALIQDAWHTLELSVNLDAGGGNDGTLSFYVDGYPIGTQITALDQAAITQMRLGAIDIDAGTTAGHLLFDNLVADDTRVFPLASRFSQTRTVTKSEHVFLGPGQLESITVHFGGALDNVLRCYDTDEANINAPSRQIIPELSNIQGSMDSMTYSVPQNAGSFQRGCYVELTGTNPRASVTARRATSGIPAIRSFVRHRPTHGAF